MMESNTRSKLLNDLAEVSYQIERQGSYISQQIEVKVLLLDIKEEIEIVEKLVIDANRIISEIEKL